MCPPKICTTTVNANSNIWATMQGCVVFNNVSNSISLISRRQVHLSMRTWKSITSTPHNILSQLLTAFPHNHCRNNRQRWERNESQWLSLILGKNLIRAGDWTSDLQFSSPVRYRLSYEARPTRQGNNGMVYFICYLRRSIYNIYRSLQTLNGRVDCNCTDINSFVTWKRHVTFRRRKHSCIQKGFSRSVGSQKSDK